MKLTIWSIKIIVVVNKCIADNEGLTSKALSRKWCPPLIKRALIHTSKEMLHTFSNVQQTSHYFLVITSDSVFHCMFV